MKTLLVLIAACAALAVYLGCYHGNPPWPGDPTAPPAPFFGKVDAGHNDGGKDR